MSKYGDARKGQVCTGHYVYVAKAVGYDNVYKIGGSMSPECRVKGLKSQYKNPFELIYKTENRDGHIESAVKSAFADRRYKGFNEKDTEMFRVTEDEIVGLVKELEALGYEPVKEINYRYRKLK